MSKNHLIRNFLRIRRVRVKFYLLLVIFRTHLAFVIVEIPMKSRNFPKKGIIMAIIIAGGKFVASFIFWKISNFSKSSISSNFCASRSTLIPLFKKASWSGFFFQFIIRNKYSAKIISITFERHDKPIPIENFPPIVFALTGRPFLFLSILTKCSITDLIWGSISSLFLWENPRESFAWFLDNLLKNFSTTTSDNKVVLGNFYRLK